MTDMTEHYMADFRQPLSDRLPAFLARRLPHAGRDKHLAREIDVDPRTARNILAGHWPSREAWRGIVRAFGRDVLDAVFAPEIDEVLARQAAEIKALEEQLANRRARYRAVAGAATADLEGAE
jgi:hypothetical protein